MSVEGEKCIHCDRSVVDVGRTDIVVLSLAEHRALVDRIEVLERGREVEQAMLRGAARLLKGTKA